MQYTPKHEPGRTRTMTAATDVIGGRLVEITGDRAVSHATPGSTKVCGIAAFDATQGFPVTVHTLWSGVHKVLAATPVTAGDRLTAATDGKVAPATATDHAYFLAETSADTDALVEATMI